MEHDPKPSPPRFKQGDRIFFTGDRANAPSFCTVALWRRDVNTEWLCLTTTTGRRLPEISAAQISDHYDGTARYRFVTRPAYMEWRRRQPTFILDTPPNSPTENPTQERWQP